MGCQASKCSQCGGAYKVCQLVNGLCSNCRAATTQQNWRPNEYKGLTSQPLPPSPVPVSSDNDVYYS